MDKFSIVIPVYNGAKTIERLLGSIITQREFVEEVLVCNDRSSDDTVKIVNLYKKILPIEIINVPPELNGYPGNARQCGVDVAKGKWIVFADADDMLSFTSLFYYSEIIKKEPEAKLIMCAHDQIGENYDPQAHYVASIPWVHGKAFNTEYVKQHNIRFPKNVFTHEDKYFVMRNVNCLKAEGLNAVVSDFTTYFWMMSENSIVHSKDYALHSFGESCLAVVEPLEMCKEEYSLSDEKMRELFIDDAVNCIAGMYSKMQSFYYFYQKRQIETSYETFLECYSRIKKLFNLAKQEIIDAVIANPDLLQNIRIDAIRVSGNYVDFQTFAQFIEEAEYCLKKAG